MFVWMPENTTIIVLFSTVIGIIGFGYALYTHSKLRITQYLQITGIFLLGIFLAVFPWVLKNGFELGWKNISVPSLLNGSGNVPSNGSFVADYSKIYTPEELQTRVNQNNFSMITGSGTSLNEDFARYFGQESGLNNYIKLPANLTFQKNQNGEFTDITYIFLAFVPVSLLFLRAKYEEKYKNLWI